jgi:hypothetical protein
LKKRRAGRVRFDSIRKLSEAEKQARLVPAKVPPSRRKEVLDRATSMVKAEAQIDFCRDVRR